MPSEGPRHRKGLADAVSRSGAESWALDDGGDGAAPSPAPPQRLHQEISDVEVIRRQAARDRARAAADRERAAHERDLAARAREEAVRDRREAARDRARAAREREQAATDSLTGARARGTGLADLQREIDRSRRTGSGLVLAFVDVDGLKAVNDRDGHLAGDHLLREVAGALRAGLRSYDLIVRVGGDEFLCALTGVALSQVRRRFDDIGQELAARVHGGSISAGFAELGDYDDMWDLIARADDALRDGRVVKRPMSDSTPRDLPPRMASPHRR